MGQLAELLAAGQRQVLDFFVVGLREVSEPDVDRHVLLYNASVLAHFAQTSTTTDTDWPTPATLATVFDHFVVSPDTPADCELLETAGAQCLLLAGFFEDQMRRRHSIRWYAQLGAGFFDRAARLAPTEPKARVLGVQASEFEPWRKRHSRLARDLRDQYYMLRLPKLDEDT